MFHENKNEIKVQALIRMISAIAKNMYLIFHLL